MPRQLQAPLEQARSNAPVVRAALLRDGCWSYVFGDLTPASAPDLIAGAELFATSTDGLIPWRGRPDSLKRGLIARIPPLDILKDIP